MKTLETYIIENVKIKEETEALFIAFRIITHASSLIEYAENSLIRQKGLYNEIVKKRLEHMLGNYMMLAVHYVPHIKYRQELDNLITYKEDKLGEMKVPALISSVNHIVHTASEIINSISSTPENNFYVSELLIEGIKQVYALCEFSNISVDTIRNSMYDKKDILLRTTSDIIRNKDLGYDKYAYIDIIMENGTYIGIQSNIGSEEKEEYSSGDIIKDFFTCTKKLREAKKVYKYSSELYDYFLTHDNIEQAYIFKGNLTFVSDIKVDEINAEDKTEEEFEKNYHHVLVTDTIQSMDDFLDYLYSQ